MGILSRLFSRKKPKKVSQDVFVAFDFETTGLNANTDDIIQAGAVRYVNGVEVDSFNVLAKPYKDIDPRITDITGISNEDVKNAPSPEAVIHQLIDFIDSSPIVAHNAPFDLKFLMKYAVNYYPETYDTLKIMRDILPYGESCKLGDLMERFGIEGDWHDALSDCRACAELFVRFCRENTQPYLKGNTYIENGAPVAHYITKESVMEYEASLTEGSSFSDEEQTFIDALNTLDYNHPLYALKKGGYIVFRTMGAELFRLKVNKRSQYVLLPGNPEDYLDLGLEITEATATECKSQNYVRAILTKPEDLEAFTDSFKEIELHLNEALELLELKWEPK